MTTKNNNNLKQYFNKKGQANKLNNQKSQKKKI